MKPKPIVIYTEHRHEFTKSRMGDDPWTCVCGAIKTAIGRIILPPSGKTKPKR